MTLLPVVNTQSQLYRQPIIRQIDCHGIILSGINLEIRPGFRKDGVKSLIIMGMLHVKKAEALNVGSHGQFNSHEVA